MNNSQKYTHLYCYKILVLTTQNLKSLIEAPRKRSNLLVPTLLFDNQSKNDAHYLVDSTEAYQHRQEMKSHDHLLVSHEGLDHQRLEMNGWCAPGPSRLAELQVFLQNNQKYIKIPVHEKPIKNLNQHHLYMEFISIALKFVFQD